MTELEAVNSVKQSEYDMAQKMCPVFGKKCLGSKCMSYYSGIVKKWSGGYVAHKVECRCALVTGTIINE